MKNVFITWLTHDFKASEELMFCWSMLKRSLPADVAVLTMEIDDMAAPTVSDILACIGSGLNEVENIFISVRPDFLAVPDSFTAMNNILIANDDIECVLPVNMQTLPENARPSFLYYTLHGFERFSTAIKKDEVHAAESHKLNNALFLIRKATLFKLHPTTKAADVLNKLAPSKILVTNSSFIHSFSDYYSMERLEVLEFIPEYVNSILDIGCAGGILGAYIKEKRGCRVSGIEMNPHIGKGAAGKLDMVIIGDFLTAALNEHFDCILCLDVLEHVSDTANFLKKVRDSLSDNGFLVLSVPNIAHWSIVQDLLAGRWDYIPAGTLCITHLRFFTKKTILTLLECAGFKVLFIKDQIATPSFEFETMIRLAKNTIEVDEKNLSAIGYYIIAQRQD